MKRHNPPYPGEIIRDQCLEPLGLVITVAAKGLGVRRKTLSERVNGHSGISPGKEQVASFPHPVNPVILSRLFAPPNPVSPSLLLFRQRS